MSHIPSGFNDRERECPLVQAIIDYGEVDYRPINPPFGHSNGLTNTQLHTKVTSCIIRKWRLRRLVGGIGHCLLVTGMADYLWSSDFMSVHRAASPTHHTYWIAGICVLTGIGLLVWSHLCLLQVYLLRDQLERIEIPPTYIWSQKHWLRKFIEVFVTETDQREWTEVDIFMGGDIGRPRESYLRIALEVLGACCAVGLWLISIPLWGVFWICYAPKKLVPIAPTGPLPAEQTDLAVYLSKLFGPAGITIVILARSNHRHMVVTCPGQPDWLEIG